MTRQYSNTSKSMRLMAAVTAVGTTLTVDDATGLPSTFPYNVVVDPDTSLVEVMSVTSSSGNTLTVSRGQQDTPASAHAVSAVVYHAWTALDGQEAQSHYEATGDVHGIGSTADVVGTDTTQTLSNKSISGSSNTLTALPAEQVQGTLKTVVAEGATAANVAVIAQAVTGQTADIQQWKDESGATRARINSAGELVLSGTVHADPSGTTFDGDVEIDGSLAITGTASTIRAVTTDDFIVSRVTGDSVDRLAIDADGTINLGPGNAARDTHFYRAGVGVLETDGDFTALGDTYVGGNAEIEGTLLVNASTTITGAMTATATVTGATVNATSDLQINGVSFTPVVYTGASVITVAAGWTLSEARMVVIPAIRLVTVFVTATRTGGSISSGSGSPGITDVQVGTLAQYPPANWNYIRAVATPGSIFPAVMRIEDSGIVWLEAFSAPSLTFNNGDGLQLNATYIAS